MEAASNAQVKSGHAGRWIALAVVVFVAGGFGAWKYMKAQEDKAQRAALIPSVKSASIYTTSILDTHSHPGSTTFGEFFKKSETALTEVDKAMIQARANTTQTNPYLEMALAYMRDEQELLRASGKLLRGQMEASNALDRAKRMLQLATASSYGNSYALEQSDEARKEVDKDLKDAEEGHAAALAQISKLRSQSSTVVNTFGADAVIPPTSLDDVEKTLGPAKKP